MKKTYVKNEPSDTFIQTKKGGRLYEENSQNLPLKAYELLQIIPLHPQRSTAQQSR